MSHLTKSKKDKEHASSNKQKDKKTKNPKHNFHKDDSEDDDDIYETCSDSYDEDDDLDSEEENVYQVEFEIIDPKLIKDRDTLYNIIYKVHDVLKLVVPS